MRKIVVFILSICAFVGVKAQSEVFPLYFSQLGLEGTANYMGRAGAIGAVGGDIMSAHYNPAGLGIYRVAEMTFSAGLNFANTTKWIFNIPIGQLFNVRDKDNNGQLLDYPLNCKSVSFPEFRIGTGKVAYLGYGFDVSSRQNLTEKRNNI
jgi:hypothetical protein